MNPDAIPGELRNRNQWICWVEKRRNGNLTKIPKQPDGSGANAKSSDMATWGSFEDAVATAQEREGWGIGFVFSDADPYLGVDLDGCINTAAEELSPEDWLPTLNPFDETYVEKSPSGEGLHIILRDTSIPEWWTNQIKRRDKNPDFFENLELEADHEEVGVEAYDTGRYFTFTGDTLPRLGSDTVAELPDLYEWLTAAWLVFEDELPEPDKHTENRDIDLDVYNILSRASYPEGERRAHPVHDSDTGANFMVDEGGETWRCWSGDHQVTGNALHLVGMEEGIINCADWKNSELDSETWAEIFEACRDRDLIEDDGPKPIQDGGTQAAQASADAGPDGPAEPDSPGGENGIVARFREACEEYNVNPDRLKVIQVDEDRTVAKGLSDVVVTDSVGAAVMSFNEEASELSGTERQAVIARFVSRDLDANGQFFRTPHGDIYYFHDVDRDLYRVDGDGRRVLNEEFQAFTWEQYRLMAGKFSRNLGRDILSYARRNAPEREVHRFAHYDEDGDTVYVSDWGEGYYAVSPDGIEWRPNGTDLFFLHLDRAESYQYLDPDERPELPDAIPGERTMWRALDAGDAIMRLFGNRVNYSEDVALGPTEQRDQLYIHLHVLPFGSKLIGRPIMAWVGEKGSGKTMTSRAIGKFLIGSDFTESLMPDDREDFEAKVINQPLAFIDNYDDGEPWANSMLAAIATGTAVDKRELYTTNDLRSNVPDCWLSLTSREPPFRRDDVADRLLLFHVERFEDDFIGEGDFLNAVQNTEDHPNRRDHLWSVYLDNIQNVLTELVERDTGRMSSSHRMADWAILARIAADALGIEDVDEMLETMQAERATFALDGEDWPAVLGEWIDENPRQAGDWRGAGELHDELEQAAEANRREYDVGSASTLGRKLTKYHDELDTIYGMEIDDSGKSNKYRFGEGQGADWF